MNIVNATNEHIAWIAAAEARIFSDAWSEAALRSHLSLSTSRALLAIGEGGEALGYLLGCVIAPEGEVYRIATLPEHRRGGVGDALLSAFLTQADECFLEVRASNAPAIALYGAHGFSLVATRKNYYKDPTEDALIYKREKK
jgi:ribosomal-protein-alanine N-acetyltransferase